MIIVMHAHASPEEVQAVVDRVGELGLKPHLSTGTERTIIGAIGEGTVASAAKASSPSTAFESSGRCRTCRAS